MFSRQEVIEFERYERKKDLKAKQKQYCGDLVKQVEELQALLAFYLGEDENLTHEREQEYRKLASLLPSKRSKKQVKRLVKLARAFSDAKDASDKAFNDALDNIGEEETEDAAV